LRFFEQKRLNGHPHGAAPELHPVTSEAQYAAALDALLAAPIFPDAALSAEGRSAGGFAHVAVISAAPLPGLADIYNGSRVTVLKPGTGSEGLQPDGTVLICYESPEQLGRVEL
jgi:hypothetical protein